MPEQEAPRWSRYRTERLELRAASVDDLAQLYEIHHDAATWRHKPAARHLDPATTERAVRNTERCWRRDRLGYWAVRLAGTDQIIGIGGAERRPDHWNLYYRFRPSAWGHGYATEVCRAAVEAATDLAPALPIVAWIDPVNEESSRVARRLGLIDRGTHMRPSGNRMRGYSDRPLPGPAEP